MQFFSVLLSVWLNIGADFIDKSVARTGRAQNFVFWTNVIQFFLLLPLIGLVGPIRYDDLVLCAFVGALTAYGRIPWFQALSLEGQDLSRLTPFVRLSGVFVLIGAIFVLNEPYSPGRLVGGGLVILASIVVLLDKPLDAICDLLAHNKAPLYAILFAISIAAVPLLYKFLVNDGYNLFSIYFYLKLFQALFIVLSSSHGAISSLRTTSFLAFKWILFARILQTAAALLYLYALTDMDLSVAEPIAALGPFFVIAVEIAIRWKIFGLRKLVSEQLSYRVIATRACSVALACIGLLMMLRP
jgi:drug/metabolite transporter (DMT)-like permease